MTSAPNHQPPLSGNNVVWFAIFAVFALTLGSCAKKITAIPRGREVQVIVPDKPNAQNDKDQPSETGKDTISSSPWTPPVKGDEGSRDVVGYKPDFQSRYNVKLLLPLTTSEADLSSSKYIQYYAGVLTALDQLDAEQVKLDVQVFDTENAKVQDRLSEIINKETDLVIGPFEKDEVKFMTDACKEAKVPLVSPWHTSSKSTVDNPYYIQLKPNLKEHFRKLVASIVADYKKEEVVIVGKNNKDANAWIAYFQEVAKELNGSTNFFGTGYLAEEQVLAGKSSFSGVLSGKVKAIVFPNYSFSDETFLVNALKRLLVEKGSKNIAVYGMPILYDSDKIEFECYPSLKMRIVVADFVEEQNQDIHNFRRLFFEKYGEIPSPDAIRGYDMMIYFGRNLWKYGRSFQFMLENEPVTNMQSSFRIEKAKAEDSATFTDQSKFDFFENKHLDIIEFKDDKFVVRN
jgi:ABC-type branched-subunit amino acid transport system substrate-binding protein